MSMPLDWRLDDTMRPADVAPPPSSTGGTMPPLEEKPFRSETESDREPAEIRIRMGHPRVRPHVVPASRKTSEPTKDDFVTSFLVAWQPSPTPPAHWIE